jgi:heterodisulfide reductase subunit B
VRALVAARDKGQDLLTLCSACHHVIKRVNNDMANDQNVQLKANNYMALDVPYTGETTVIHYLEMLRDKVGFDKIKEKVVNPLKGKKIGAYYGCLLLRPSKEMAFDNPENPTIIEEFIKAIGGTPVIYPMRNECCGAYVSLKDTELPKKRSKMVLDSAKEKGAEMVITACPLCLYNLEQNGGGVLTVKYFTELLAQALGVKEATGNE